MPLQPISGILLAAALGISGTTANGQTAESLRNRPELSLPFVEGKPVVAHFMTDLIFHRGTGQGDINSPEMYRRDGASKEIGGMIQHFPMVAKLHPDMSLEECAGFEMRAAKRLGIDGFQFYFPLTGNKAYMERSVTIIQAFFRVAEKEFPGFKLTLCLCNPRDVGNEEEMIQAWGGYIRKILEHSKDSGNWLRTPDGRYIFFEWIGDALADRVPKHWQVKDDPKLIGDVAVAYEKLAGNIGIPMAMVYHLRWPKDRAHVEAVLDYFPAIWGWTDSYRPDDGWEQVANSCKKRKRTYTQTIYPDYYTSKLYRRANPKEMLFRYKDAKALGVENLERQYQICHLSYLFRKLLERAIKVDAPMVNLVTWNDYPEGHHLAPEINHNFGFALLLHHYKSVWKGQVQETPESAVVFFKKYRHDVVPKPFAINIRTKASVGEESGDDGIEIVTLLKEPGSLFVNGDCIGKVGAGLQAHKIPSRPGKVHVQVKRGELTVIDFTTPEAITKKPYRTDRLTYSYSSEFGRFFTDLFGDAEPFTSNEYSGAKD